MGNNQELTKEDLVDAFEEAFKRVLTNEQLRKTFWKAGYDELLEHTTSGAARWTGRKILSAIGGAVIAFGLWLGFNYGGWGK